MPISEGNIIFQCDGGPGGRGREESVDESYSEEDEEEETSSTSVEDEEDSEEEDDTDEEEEDEGEERNIKRPTRNSGPPPRTQQMNNKGNNSEALQRGRVTRQKAKEAMPTKRLLRSRNKSPLPPRPGSRVNQVFKCPNCRKEFNNKASLSRHMGWCKQKPSKEKSPRKKKGDEIKKGTPKQTEGDHVIVAHSSSSSTPNTSRGRGRPKKNSVPSNPTPSTSGTKAEDDFMQQRSPESSPGVLDTSSEEDYEQKEFAANAHQLISHRNSSCSSGPIDVVNPDPDPSVQTEGPVTCPQCKMTYRTFAGFQNHIPTCTPYSSDEESEDNEDDDVDVVHSDASQFQHRNRVNWGVHQTLSETMIAPSPQSPPPPMMQIHEPMQEEENSEESNNSSDSLVDQGEVIDETSLHAPQQQAVNVPQITTPPQPLRFIPISPKVPVDTSPSKVVRGIRLPLDNTPQVINASGLTLERVESPQVVLNSPLRNGTEAGPKSSPIHQVTATPPPFEPQQTPPPPPQFHAVPPSHPSTQSSYSSPIYTQSSPFQGQPHHHHHSIPLPTTTASVTTASSMPFSLLQQAHASGNPPTYTQAQLMPHVVNSMMQVPQQMSTSSGDTYHQPGPPQTQLLQQQNYATSQPFLGYTSNQGIPQQVFRYPNGIPSSGIHSMAGQTHPHILQQQQMAFANAQGQMLRHPVPLDQQQQQRMQVPPQQLAQYLNPATGTLDQIPGQLQGQTPGQNNVGAYGLSTNPSQVNFAQLQQSNAQMQQLGNVNPSQGLPFQTQQSNMMIQQQMTAPQQPIQTSHSQPQVNSQLPSQTHPNIPQQQMQQLQYPFFHNQTSLQKIDLQGGGGSGQQPIQQVPQYSIMPQQSQTVGNGTGGLPIGVQMHAPPQQNPQLQQQHLTHPSQQQQLANVSNIFGQFATPNQPQAIPSQGASISTPQPPNENGGSLQVQQQQLSQSMMHQPNAMNMAQNQVELNIQQQSQLQQQQQQFMALQQQQILAAQAQQQQVQQQQQQSTNRNAPQQMQITPQNLQSLMMNPSALQWGKPQTLAQAPQQVASNRSSPATQQNQTQPQTSGSTQSTPQQILPQQVIQQIAQVTDQAGNTYIIITQPQQQGTQNGMSTGNNGSQVVNLVPGLQTLQCQQQQQQVQRPSSTASQCSANGTPSHSPGSTSVGSVGKSAPCPCATCLEKLANPHMDKYKKVLPYPSSGDHFKPIAPLLAPKQPISIRPAISKQPHQPKVIRLQTGNSPRPSTVALLQPNALQQGSQLRMVTVQQQQQLGLLTPTTPNIAVVNPLQRLSDQISQIESTFLSTPPRHPQVSQPATSTDNQSSSPLQGPHFTLVTTSPPISSASPPSHVTNTMSTPINVDVTENSQQQNVDTILNMPTPRLGLVDHGISPMRHASTPTPSTTPQQLTPNGNSQSPSSGVETGSTSSETSSSGVKRKILEVSPSSSGGGPAAKSIKLLLNRKGGGDTYTVNMIAGASPKGTMRKLKIKGKIKSGEKEGTETEGVVVPRIHFVPIPDPDASEMEGNRTIAEDGQQTVSSGTTNRQNLRLTHRAVIVYEVQLQGATTEPFRSSDVRAVWSYIFETVQGMWLPHNLPPLQYPATNISLSQNGNGKEADVTFNRLGLTHRAIQFLLKELKRLQAMSQPQQHELSSTKVSSPSPKTPTTTIPHVLPPSSSTSSTILPMPSEGNENDEDEELLEENESGCARFERFMGRKEFDMFGWLASKHRRAPAVCNAPMETPKALSAPIAMRFRKLKEYKREHLVVWWSKIHGRGLYTKRDVGKGEMIIEYAGEVIRPLVCDMREKYYESKAIGCYMFRINDHVIDATMKGNAARFINHSCEPNCEAKAIKIAGKDHIVIFALRQIDRGEELTYDYKFEKEEEKIPCLCRSKHCRKYLN